MGVVVAPNGVVQAGVTWQASDMLAELARKNVDIWRLAGSIRRNYPRNALVRGRRIALKSCKQRPRAVQSPTSTYPLTIRPWHILEGLGSCCAMNAVV